MPGSNRPEKKKGTTTPHRATRKKKPSEAQVLGKHARDVAVET